jgi:hypothetical protein
VTIAGVPWADVREAGRLDRLYREISWAHRKESGTLSSFDRWFDPVPALLRWAGVLALLAMALDGDPSVGVREGLLALGAAFLSLPLFRLGMSAHLDSFEALRAPSRKALLLARWVDLGPAALVAGAAWAAYFGMRIRSVDDLPTRDVAIVLACLALLPLRVATVGAWKKCADDRLDDGPSAFLRCCVFGAAGAGLSLAIASIRGSFLSPAAVPALLALVFVGGAIWHLVRFARRGAGGAAAWGRALLRVVLSEVAGTAFLVGIGATWLVPALLRREEVAWFPGLLSALALAAVPVTAFAGAALALRDIRTTEVAAPRFDRRGAVTEVALAEERDKPGSKARPHNPMGPGRRPRRGAWEAHAGLWRDGLTMGSTLPLALFSALLLLGLHVGLHGSPSLGWVLILTGLLFPRRIGVDHRARAYLLGMDLREQVRHDFRALLLLALAPALLVSVGLIAVTGWREGHASALALLASVFLLRAGWPGFRNVRALDRIPFARPWGIPFVVIALVLPPVMGGILDAAGSLVLGQAAFLAMFGAAGVALSLTRSEEDLREEMRIRET